MRGAGRSRREAAARIFPQLQPKPFVLDLELGEIVLAHQIEDLLHLVELEFHQSHSSSSSVVTSVKTSTPCSVTSTSSSIRTPPQLGRYAPGSIVKTMPGATCSSRVSTSGRRLTIRGS